MLRLKLKLSLFNIISKLAFTAIFLVFMPVIIERISLRQVDNELIKKREEVIDLISGIGIEPFITADSSSSFGSYNILKEEFISLERIDQQEDLNFIEVASRIIENEEIEYRVLNYSFLVDDEKYLLEIGRTLESITYTAGNTRKVMLLFLIFIIGITFLADLQYTRRILRPLDRITDKLKGISDPSIFDKTRVKSTTADFVSLDNALREMMEHIDNLFQKEKEITANMSHELMTPISVLRSKLENMLLRDDVDDEIAEKTEESLRTLHRLQTIVNSLLMIARIESQQFLKNDEVLLSDLLGEISAELQPLAEDAGINLSSDFKPDPGIVKASRALLFSMFYNVVNNSVKNTASGGHIIIKGCLIANKIIVEISDTGRGMTPEQVRNLFSRFRNRTENSGDGTGIGLAITKTVADFHNIEIKVESSPGKGTKFLFLFP